MSVCLSSEQQVVICRGTFNCYASLFFYCILYFSALLPFWEKAISRVLNALIIACIGYSSKTETDRLFSQKILPNFWLTAILTTSV